MRPRHLLPFLVLAFAALGCSQLGDSVSSNPSNSTANSNTTTAEANNTTQPAGSLPGTITASADPQKDIESMADRWFSQKSFKAKTANFGDKNFQTETEFQAPNRLRLKTGKDLQTIVIGKDVYLSMDGSFEKMSGSAGVTIPNLRSIFDKESRKLFSDVKFVGEEMVEGKPALVYAYHNKGLNVVDENDSKVWISKEDGLPIKIEATYKSGSTKSMKIEFDFKTPVTIEPPATRK